MKKFKGENIEKIKFTNNSYIAENDVPRNREYRGYVQAVIFVFIPSTGHLI